MDCEFSEWSAWDACSCTCKGIHQRTRHITKFPQEGGKNCEGSLKEIQACNIDTCAIDSDAVAEANSQLEQPVDCKISEWASWGSCSHTCGGGLKHRSRHVLQYVYLEFSPFS